MKAGYTYTELKEMSYSEIMEDYTVIQALGA
jgi:hypothetical protein